MVLPLEEVAPPARREDRPPDPQISILGVFRQQVKQSGDLSLEGVLDPEVERDRGLGGGKKFRDLAGPLDMRPLVGSGDRRNDEGFSLYREEDLDILKQGLPDGRGGLADRNAQPGELCGSLPGDLPRRRAAPPGLRGLEEESGSRRGRGEKGGEFLAGDVFEGEAPFPGVPEPGGGVQLRLRVPFRYRHMDREPTEEAGPLPPGPDRVQPELA